MLEIEMKFSVQELATLEQRLRQETGVVEVGIATEADHYLNAPDRDFAVTDEALRVRTIGSAGFVTYKGPKRQTPTKTRTEIEVPLEKGEGNADDLIHLFQQLGYRSVAVVRKKRQTFRVPGEPIELKVCLDQVEHVGSYAELEAVVDEGLFEKGQEAVLGLARRLGLSEMERRSYLKLFLLAQERSPCPQPGSPQ